MVLDAVVRHLESLVVEREGGGRSDDDGDTAQTLVMKIWERDDGLWRAEEGHTRLTAKTDFYYVNNKLVDSTYPGWIQSEFDTLMGLFNRVGLRTNVCKTMGIV